MKGKGWRQVDTGAYEGAPGSSCTAAGRGLRCQDLGKEHIEGKSYFLPPESDREQGRYLSNDLRWKDKYVRCDDVPAPYPLLPALCSSRRVE